MSRNFKASSDLGGESSAIKQPGTYHCQVTHAADGESTRGKPITGVSAILSVLAGTVEGQVEKEFHLHLYDPDLQKSPSSQEWCQKKQTAYGVAINQIDPSKLGEEMNVDFGSAAEGQQLVITLEENEYQGNVKLEVSYANIFHVDDPRAAGFPKSSEALELLPAELRKSPEYFGTIAKKSVSALDPKSRIKDEQFADL